VPQVPATPGVPQASAAPGAPSPATVPSAPEPAPDPQLERLERLAALRDSGGITPEDYDAQKAKILEGL